MSDFYNVIADLGYRFLRLCSFAVESRDNILERKLLGNLHFEAAWLQEALDAMGAVHNSKWCIFRDAVSAQKLFTEVCYDLLHVQSAAPYYDLLPVEGEFMEDINRVLKELSEAIYNISSYILKKSRKVQKEIRFSKCDFICMTAFPEEQKMVADRKIRHLKNPAKSPAYLATKYLNLKHNILVYDKIKEIAGDEYCKAIPELISEEMLRLIAAQFHNLQSLYDTYLAQSDLEMQDHDLKRLRGHISVIFHLLNSAVGFAHYYERHIDPYESGFFKERVVPLKTEKHLNILVDFFVNFADKYFLAGRELCRKVLQKHVEVDTIEVEIPQYRGFHVRPSTLISKIINHYGSDVVMDMDGHSYDPSSPLELFRVNEQINADKRKYIGEFLEHSEFLKEFDSSSFDSWKKMAQLLLLKLMDSEKIVLYDKNLSLDNNNPFESETPGEFMRRVISQFLASGKIDIQKDIKVKFTGDKRVLHDIQTLSKWGYGEDKFGNNILLPGELSYLRRESSSSL